MTHNKQVILVTGGSRGIGRSIVDALVRLNHEVIVAARSEGSLPLDLVKFVKCDLATVQGVNTLINAVPRVDVLVNNAGLMFGVSYDKYSDEMRTQVLQLNLETPLALSWHYGSLMAGVGQGRIVNNASIAGEIGHPDIWYGVTKAGVINFTKSIAKALGPKGVVTNAFAAGPVMTDMLAMIPEERQAAIKRTVISGRFALPEEVAIVACWLALESPAYINGVCIDINNGAFPR